MLTLPLPAPPPRRARYARLVGAGLALSALGDALLVWPQHFVPGMAAFAAAHVAYISAFGWGASWPQAGAACYAVSGYFLSLLAPPGALRLLVPLYGLLLATMAWRALAQARGRGLRSGRAAGAAGALLFLLSDTILGYSMFGGALPYSQVSGARGGDPPPPARRPALTPRCAGGGHGHLLRGPAGHRAQRAGPADAPGAAVFLSGAPPPPVGIFP